jgi:hypothetical protein
MKEKWTNVHKKGKNKKAREIITSVEWSGNIVSEYIGKCRNNLRVKLDWQCNTCGGTHHMDPTSCVLCCAIILYTNHKSCRKRLSKGCYLTIAKICTIHSYTLMDIILQYRPTLSDFIRRGFLLWEIILASLRLIIDTFTTPKKKIKVIDSFTRYLFKRMYQTVFAFSLRDMIHLQFLLIPTI